LLPTISPLFLFTPTSPTDIHTLSLHDALPILVVAQTRAAGNVDFLKVHTSFAVAVHVFAYPSRDPAASVDRVLEMNFRQVAPPADRKSTRLNSSHVAISYAVFCLKKKKKK